MDYSKKFFDLCKILDPKIFKYHFVSAMWSKSAFLNRQDASPVLGLDTYNLENWKFTNFTLKNTLIVEF